MTDPPRRAGLTVRPSPDDKAAAQDALKAAEWSMEDFIAACLRFVARDPAKILAMLAADRPKRHSGRPRKDGTPPTSA